MKALKDPGVLEKLRVQGTEPLGSTPKAYGDYIQSEIKRWAGVVKSTGVSLD
ncbi:Tripartite tricarboxylate transporter family receptor [compost metagenome]